MAFARVSTLMSVSTMQYLRTRSSRWVLIRTKCPCLSTRMSSLLGRMKEKASHSMGLSLNSIVLLVGGTTQHQYDTDRELRFRQESHFMYLFGCADPDCYGAIDLSTGESILFVPRLPEEYAVWEGVIHPLEHYKEKYAVDRAEYTDNIEKFVTERKPDAVHVLRGVNSDSGAKTIEATFPGMDKFNIDGSFLYSEICECRVFKSPEELEILRYVSRISSEAHKAVMRSVRPGMMEYQMESQFLHETYSRGGCRFMAYTCICGSGKSGATLHYGHNNKQIAENDMLLLDMGAEYHGYTSDITCSYPATGKFSADQRDVYETVLAAQLAVMKAMKPGVPWPAMHRLAERVICEELLKRGFLQGSIDDLIGLHVGATFMPHGLGHLMGMDVHDVGGYPNGTSRIQEPGINRLRTSRILQPGMVITVEPGVYFIDCLLDAAKKDAARTHLFCWDKIERFRGFGGVRLEDDVLVTADGIENLTQCPRTVDEVEAEMAKGCQ
eukprot:Opistho-2@70610